MKITSIDPGLTGSIYQCIHTGSEIKNESVINMPIIKKEIKSPIYIYDLKDGKKQYYKSGINKGKPKKKLKTKGKYKKELDVELIYNIMINSNHIIIEQQNPRPGTSAMSSATTMKNFGILIGLAKLANIKNNTTIHIVQPNVWKKALGLDMSKLDRKKLTQTEYKKISINKAIEFSNLIPKNDGQADAICIGHYIIQKEINKI